HCTFLDPYLTVDWNIGMDNYGQYADWSDSYAASDISGVFTQGTLVHAHNVDVTWLDPDLTHLPFNIVLSSHSWPHDFYYDTVVSGVLSGTGNYGFPLSKEEGNWGSIGSYPEDQPPVMLPLASTPPPSQPALPLRSATLALNLLPSAASSS